MRARRIVLLALLLLVAAAVAGVAEPRLGHGADATAKTISVTGTGTASAVPTRATFGFSVETRAKTATDALARNGDAAAAVVAALKAAGVAAADIQTSQVALSPQTNPDGTDIVGFDAVTSVTVRTTVARAGALVDAAVKAGATGFSGPSLGVEDEQQLYRAALKDAVANARAKAQALAEAGGLTLGAVQSIAESGAPTPGPLAGQVSSGRATIEPGTQDVTATVTVTYAAS